MKEGSLIPIPAIPRLLHHLVHSLVYHIELPFHNSFEQGLNAVAAHFKGLRLVLERGICNPRLMFFGLMFLLHIWLFGNQDIRRFHQTESSNRCLVLGHLLFCSLPVKKAV